ncbi:alpha/beta fold hydrolase [Sphingomonas flavalba]|uniref:alpha/beta fold hydrolase n=1 Tax=Sphingomonas flavalba TaxID=2559804 RepID=UPI00109DAFEC|nr:alpha/beta hydrolase [Sphingomonas flavalba]
MIDLERRRIPLPTGVTLDVTLGGPEDGDALIFLHGFPESARTWRHQLTELARDHFVVAPDQRGFAGSSKPEGVDAYRTAQPIADLLALADTLDVDRFTLIGHDWGGAVAWAAALARPDRVARLVILNAPHPLIFQRTLIDDPAQRAASQYIRAFRDPGMEAAITAMGLGTFFDASFRNHADLSRIPADERAAYLAEWGQPGALTGMLNWYRAASVVVPAPNEMVERPAFIDAPFPPVTVPTLVVWGTRDAALLPCQLEGLDGLIDDLTLVRVDAGHFLTWEAPEPVNRAIRAFLAARPAA